MEEQKCSQYLVGLGCFPFILDRPVQLTNEKWNDITRSKEIFRQSLIQVSNKVWLLLRVCVCVTENRNLCKGTAVRFSQTGSTGQRKQIPVIDHFCENNSFRSSVSMEISRQFGTMESTPSMPLSFV